MYSQITKYSQERNKIDRQIYDKYIGHVLHRLKILILKENEKGKVAPIFRKKYLVKPQDVFEKCFVRISVASLYRRYRAIYINGLTEALAIAQKYDSKEDVIRHLRQKIIEAGTVEKDVRKRLEGK